MAKETWQTRASESVSVESVLKWCRSVADAGCDGVTISGGEPFEQPAALEHLLWGLVEWRNETRRTMDFLCYSGFPRLVLERDHHSILALLDAVIPEPFEVGLPSVNMRGSSNQPIVALTPLGQERYGAAIAERPSEKRLQVHTDGDRIWLIGIPQRDDLSTLAQKLRERGILPR